MPAKQNPLYFFIKHDHSITAKPQIVFNTSKDSQKNYAVITLPSNNNDVMVIGGSNYEIENLHVTIFEDYTAFSHQSDYHCTFHIKNTQEERYSLHVYFDAHDRVVYSGVDVSVPLTDEDQRLINKLAIMHSAPVLSQLRRSHRALIEQLTNVDAQKSVTTLFSMPVFTHQEVDACQQAMIPVMHRARLLKDIGGSAFMVDSLKRYQLELDWILAELSSEQMNLASVALPEETKPQNEPSILIKPQPRPQPKRVVAAHAKPVDDPAVLQSHIDTMLQCKQHYATTAELNTLLAYDKAAHMALGAWLDSESQTHSGTSANLIYGSIVESQQACVNHLQRALITGDMASADRLKGFVSHLPDKLVQSAIGRPTTELLKWLLTHGEFPVNRIRVIHNDDEISLLEYTVIRQKPDCFTVLLDHGASSLIMTKNGFPLAHNICRSGPENDAFRTALFVHHAQHGLRPFCNQLAAMLTTIWESSCTLTADEVIDIESAIEYYRATAKTNQHGTDSKAFIGTVANQINIQNQVRSRMPAEQWRDIQSSPEVIARRDQIATLEIQLKNKLSRQQYAQITQQARIRTSKIEEYLEKTGVCPSLADVISGMDDNIKIAELGLELIQITTEMNKYKNRLYKKLPKEYKLLESRYNDVNKELKFLDNKQNMALDLSLTMTDLNQAIHQLSDIVSTLPSDDPLVTAMQKIQNSFRFFKNGTGYTQMDSPGISQNQMITSHKT